MFSNKKVFKISSLGLAWTVMPDLASIICHSLEFLKFRQFIRLVLGPETYKGQPHKIIRCTQTIRRLFECV